MKQMVCEMCESNDLIKQDGVFVCQSCGMKYSVEEAKKMMCEGSTDVQNSDNSMKLETYFDLANTAKKAGNYSEAEKYCNNIIELEPSNYLAWVLKGESAAWQSSLNNSRLDEGIVCFARGINSAPEDKLDEITEYIKEQIKDLTLAMVSLRIERFEKWPDEEEAHYLIEEMSGVINTATNFLDQTKVVIPLQELFSPIAIKINNAVIHAWDHIIVPEYLNDSDGHPDDFAFKQFVARGSCCSDLLIAVNNLMDDDYSNIQRYKNAISIQEAIMEGCSYEYRTVTHYSYSGNHYTNQYCKNLELTESAKSIRRKQIAEYRQKIEIIKKAEEDRLAEEKAEEERIAKMKIQKRFDDYWSKHAEEKIALENEKNTILSQIEEVEASCGVKIDSLNKEYENIAELSKIQEIELKIQKLFKDKENLGFFKKKEKNEIQSEIDELNINLQTIKNSVKSQQAELNEKINTIQKNTQSTIASLQNRLDEISEELTKER